MRRFFVQEAQSPPGFDVLNHVRRNIEGERITRRVVLVLVLVVVVAVVAGATAAAAVVVC